MKTKNIRIRMYNQGLGDCFLLTFAGTSEEKYNILIDCGVIGGTQDPQLIMTEVAEDIMNETNKEIDVVVITHEHWDHLSGFKQARDIFNQINFNEVWLAWTENPKDDFANNLRKTREGRVKVLTDTLGKAVDKVKLDTYLTVKQKTAKLAYIEAVQQVTSLSGELGINGKSTTSEALDYVKMRGNSKVFYCDPEKEPFVIENIEGVRFYILGPPRNETLIKKDFSKKEVYQELFKSDFGSGFLSAVANPNGNLVNENYLPFDRYTGTKIEDNSKFSLLPGYYDTEENWRQIDDDWLDFAGQLALALDSDTNNTSLVLAIELINTGKFLLFPGDAQVGNWLSWFNYKWKVNNKQGITEEVDINKILENTIFLKVGHHGSHNATLRENGLEKMTDNKLTAVIPVNKKMADKKDWNMPFPALFNRIKEKTSGKVLLPDETFRNDIKPTRIPTSEWEKFTHSVFQANNQLYIDYTINC